MAYETTNNQRPIFLMSGTFMDDYTELAVLIVEGCIVAYNALLPLHFNSGG